MKKLLLLMLVLLGGVMQVSAQITESGKIKVYIQNNQNWNKVYLHYWGGTGTNTTWPGEDITSSTETIDGIVWYVKVFEGTKGWKLIANNGQSGSNEKKTEDYTTQIYGDTFFDITTSDNKLYLSKQNRFYLYNIETYLSNKLSKGSDWNNWNITIDNQTKPSNSSYVLTNSYAYDNDSKITTWQSTNVKRPENATDEYLTFAVIPNKYTWDNKTDGEWHTTTSEPAFYTMNYNSSNNQYNWGPYRTTTIGTAGYTTWSNSEKYEIDDTNVDDVYVVSADGTSKVTLTTKKGSTFPEGTGVIIKGSGEVKINAVASDAETDDMGTNYLVGSGNSEKSDIVATEGKTYVFSWDGTNASSVGFYKASGSGKLAAHKAYLELPSTTPARDFVGFDFGNATGIANVDVNTKFDANAPMYNLAGQRVNKSYKGVVIVNGKKMLNK